MEILKEMITIRLEQNQILALKELAQETKANVTKLIEIALNDFLSKQPNQNEQIKKHLEILNITETRENTKLEMRKCMFLANSRRRIIKMLQDGITEKALEKLIKVWTKEAIANGISEKEFLENIKRGVSK